METLSDRAKRRDGEERERARELREMKGGTRSEEILL